MATLQVRNDSWRLSFCYGSKQHTFTIGKVSEREANQWKSRSEQLLMRLKQGLLEIPLGCSVADFLANDGKPPVDPALIATKSTILGTLRQQYEAAYSNGALEANSLYTIGLHLDRIEETLGKRFILSGLTLGKLQSHVDRRSKTVMPVTIKKEIDSFRSVWNYGVRSKLVQGQFPSTGLVYPKTTEKLPFMSWKEIERRIKTGGDPGQLWECLYLDAAQVAELLAYVKAAKAPNWIFPMIATAAHAGMRRSELIRAQTEDVDLAGGTITVREKKRARGALTTRSVPLTKPLIAILKPLLARKDRLYLFGDGREPLSVQTTQKGFVRVLKDSKWTVLRGWHVLRHSLCSIAASNGTDQRLIDSWLGHSTEQQRKRYRHLFPHTQAIAINKLFG